MHVWVFVWVGVHTDVHMQCTFYICVTYSFINIKTKHCNLSECVLCLLCPNNHVILYMYNNIFIYLNAYVYTNTLFRYTYCNILTLICIVCVCVCACMCMLVNNGQSSYNNIICQVLHSMYMFIC